jgi:hypothetical protein
MAARRRTKLAKDGREGTATGEGGGVWRLAVREPICAYDEYSGDEIELEIGQRDPGSIEGLLIDFRYISRDREVSRRSVLCWQCGRDGDRLYIRGYCAFREELRTFRIDRMADVVAIQGEREIPVDDVVNFFSVFAAREARERPSRRLTAPD